MPFARATLTELRRQAAEDINAALPGADALLRFSNLGILADVLAGMGSGHYGYLDWIARNSVPFTATAEYLEGWAALKGVTRKPATAASGDVRFPAAAGAMLPAGTTVTRSDGVTYVTTAEVQAEGGEVIAPIIADAPGALGNTALGATLILGAGVSGVSLNGTAATALTGGADIEGDDELRSRMLAVYAAPPQGGARTDYVEWALGVPGVTRCWVVPSGMGPGTIVLLFMMDLAQASHDGFPQGTDGCASAETRDTAASGDQLALANAIFDKQPVTALVYAVAPTPNRIAVTISGLSGATASLRQAVTAAVRSALTAEATPSGTTPLSAIEGAVASVPGTAGFIITAVTASAGTIEPAGVGNILSDVGALPILDRVIFA